MVSLLFGFASVIAVVFFAVNGEFNSYMQVHSLVIVIGGSLAILFFATPPQVLKSLGRSMAGLFKAEHKFSDFSADLTALAKSRTAIESSQHPLIHYAVQLWAQGTDADLFIPLLSQKRRELELREMSATFALKNLVKYPPALGMAGTVIGMISLFANLDSAKDKIGSSLSIAMTATFLGLILANMLISPLADRLYVRQVSQQRLLDNIYEIILLIQHDEPQSLVAEEMKDRVACRSG